MNQREIHLPDGVEVSAFFGDFDSNLKLLEKALSVKICGRDSTVKISGEADCIEKCADVIDILCADRNLHPLPDPTPHQRTAKRRFLTDDVLERVPS